MSSDRIRDLRNQQSRIGASLDQLRASFRNRVLNVSGHRDRLMTIAAGLDAAAEEISDPDQKFSTIDAAMCIRLSVGAIENEEYVRLVDALEEADDLLDEQPPPGNHGS